MKRKIVAIVATFALCFSMVPATAFADTLIDVVKVTIETPEVGSTDKSIGTITVPYGAGYTVTSKSSAWHDGGGYDFDGAFKEGDTYMATFSVKPEAGYALSSTTRVEVNGSAENVSILNVDDFEFEFKFEPKSKGTIDSIVLSGVPECEKDASATEYSHETTEYEVEGKWHQFNALTGNYDEMSDSETFRAGGIYELRLNVDSKPGYVLSSQCDLIVNGSEVDWSPDEFGGIASVYTSLGATEISSISIPASALPKAEVGKAFSENVINVDVVAEDKDKYGVSGYWYYVDENNVQTRSGTFEADEVYYFQFSIVPKAGYSLAQDLELHLGDKFEWVQAANPTVALYDLRTSFATLIGEVELLNLPTASLGDTLQTGDFGVSVPAGANYTATARWLVYDSSQGTWTNVDSAAGTNVVKDRNTYNIEVDIRPKPGYEFSDQPTGKAYGFEQSFGSLPDMAWFSREFSFCELIRKAEVNGVTKPVAGAAPSTDGLSVPSDASYYIESAEWIELDDSDNYSTLTEFKQGHDYELYIELKPKA